MVLTIVGCTACYPPLPGAGGAAPSAPTPATAWQAPQSQTDRAAESRLPPDTLPPELAGRRDTLQITELVTLALDRSPETRATWLAARAAAATYGSDRAVIFPTITGAIDLTKIKTSATGGRVSVNQVTYGPSLSLSWLLFSFGEAGAFSAARNALYSANWSHNAAIADVVQRTIQGYFDYVGAEGLLGAERATFDQAQANLSAADDRRSVGVATIADVLQARTAVAQARLAVQSAEGALASAHGALATLIGLPPTATFDVDTIEAEAPVANVAASVDTLIQFALRDRPDLAAERALADQRRAEASASRAQFLPSLSATGTTANTFVTNLTGARFSYNVGLALSIPIFNGLGWQYAAEAAQLTAEAETARLRTLEQQVALQVYQTYQSFRTATAQVTAANDLFTSASANADAARARYREGVGSVLELLTAEQALASARSQQIQARVTWHTSLVQLAHDAGLLQPSGATQLPLATTPAGSP
ncbi:MAG: TolC family protein [Gemmatimonadales bacterium]